MTKSSLIDPGPITFEAELLADDGTGAACYVQFPHDLKATYGRGNRVPVRANFDGHVEYTGSLAAMGGPCAVLGVRKDILARLGKRRGDIVHVRVELDTSERVITLPEDALAALRESAAAGTAWHALSYSHQREYALWIEGAKRAETRARRIAKMVELLAEAKSTNA